MQLVRALVRQADTYPAGVFGEIGSWDEMTAVERKVFRAVGKAHVATNLPIFTHTGIPGKAAIEQLDILEDAGVDPQRVCIGHLGNLNDPNVYVHKTICRRGGFVGFDRQGGNGDANVVPLVIALLDAGFADHVLISGDASRGYARPVTSFLPKLKAAGADDATLSESWSTTRGGFSRSCRSERARPEGTTARFWRRRSMNRFTGGCLCGSVRIVASGLPYRVGLCHCLDCRKHHGALFHASAVFPEVAVTIDGETRDYAGRFFCPRCGSSVFSRSADEIEVNLGSLRCA